MEITVREILESDDYQTQKDIVQRAINWGAKEYRVDQRVFKKDDNEKDRLKYLKTKWLAKMRKEYPDFTKKNGGKKKYRQTLIDGEDI